jgi:ABC-type amino acid transport substrate-binding protein
MLYIYDAPESPMDIRYQYHWEILRTALQRTSAKWGPFRMEPAVFMGESRQTAELKNATGKLTVMYLGTSPDLESSLTPVRIPVDKNLGGYMVMLIRKEDQPKFAAIQSLDELKKFRIGLGLGWLDVDILRADGFDVVTGSSYEGLFDMLANSRFDAFSRAAVEILGEYDARQDKIPGIAIEQTFILYYPLPMYFWFTNTSDGKRLAERAREGMLAMIEDGTYDRIFFRYQQTKIDRLHLGSRKVFHIENPLLKTLQVPFEDKRLWFDPTAAQ